MPGFIPDQVLDQIRQNNDVVDVIGSYFPLKRAGANFRALCPFHKEKTPSFNVNPQKQIWHCFGCGAGGDVFGFVMKYESLEFVAAVRRLAERAGIRIEWEESAGGPSRDQRELLLKLHEDGAAWFHSNLLKEKSAEPARAYLKKREVSAEIAKRWRLGYAPDAWDALMEWAQTKKHSIALLESAGLVLPRESGEGYYDRFRGRLMFPICDDQGRVVAFSGRILTESKDQPKYVNSPETPIFQKGKLLFALDKAKRAILDEKFAIVCEGQVDTISCHEAGLANVVAPQGTALTEQHAGILKRYCDEVVLMFDADEAGQNAMVRSAESLFTAGLVMRVATLPQGHDPDSFVKAFGVEKLKNLVTKAPSFLVYLLERLSRKHDRGTDRGKLEIVRGIVVWLARIVEPTLLATYAQETARRLDIREETVRQELRRLHQQGKQTSATSETATSVPRAVWGLPDSKPAEEMLLRLMLTDEKIVAFVDERLDRAWLSDGLAAGLIARALELFTADRWTGPNALLNETHDESSSRLISELLLKPLSAETLEIDASNCLARLDRLWVERRVRELGKRRDQGALGDVEKRAVERELLDLTYRLAHIGGLSMAKAKQPRSRT